MITIRYFATLREKLGEHDTVALHELAHPTVGGVRLALMARSPLHAESLVLTAGIRSSCNHELCDDSQPVAEGAEVAFFPPVTGG
ncbi:MAG: MoaD/ThiS family protein [Aquabacterium sp.]